MVNRVGDNRDSNACFYDMSIKKQFHDSLSIKQAENSVHLRQAICVSSIGISLVFYIVCFECLVFRDLLKGGVGGGMYPLLHYWAYWVSLHRVGREITAPIPFC